MVKEPTNKSLNNKNTVDRRTDDDFNLQNNNHNANPAESKTNDRKNPREIVLENPQKNVELPTLDMVFPSIVVNQDDSRLR